MFVLTSGTEYTFLYGMNRQASATFPCLVGVLFPQQHYKFVVNLTETNPSGSMIYMEFLSITQHRWVKWI